MAKVKKRDGENLTAASIKNVIALLNPTKEGEKPITKKVACEILKIPYNTTRLDSIITEFQERQEFVKKRKAQNRGKPASRAEIADAVTQYLEGEAIANIAKSLYRSAGFVNKLITNVGVPSRTESKDNPLVPDYLPDECLRDSFEKNEIVWSARHHRTAIVEYEMSVDYQAEKAGFVDVDYEKKYSSKCYAIWVPEVVDNNKENMWAHSNSGGYRAYALAYDLGSLRHLEEYGVNLSRL